MIFNRLTSLKLPLKLSWIKQPQLAWWLEIQTIKPQCIYYFGPFTNPEEARFHQTGYVEDLLQEQAEGITIQLKKCQPQELTIDREAELD